MDRLDDGADAAGGASGSAEDPPRHQLRENPFARSPRLRAVAVELLLVLGLFAVVVIRGAEGGADALVGPVVQDEDLPGLAGLDDAIGPRAAVRSWVRPGVARENHRGVPSGRAMTCTFIPCQRCFIE